MNARAMPLLGTAALLLFTAVLIWGVVVQAMDGRWFLASGRVLVAAGVFGLVAMHAPFSWQGTPLRTKGIFFSLVFCGLVVSATSVLV